MQYLFGDSDIAVERLKALAEVFAETTRSFVLDAVTAKIGTVVDLGCGPGYTTSLLAETLRCDLTIGLDNSDHFISLAKKTAHNNLSFLLHDVTSIPFPADSSGLLYCRFLLSHLKDPQTLLARWATQLKPRGLLLIDEVEHIHTSNKVFTGYLAIVAAMLANQSTELYVGPLLHRLPNPAALERRVSQICRLQVANRQAATMFYLNMQSWKNQPYVRENYSLSIMADLENGLKALIEAPGFTSDIEWDLRQLVFERL